MAESALSLVERLRAALDRAEEIARAAKIQPQQIIEALGSVREADMKFIVINRPDVVLRTVAAHRKILDEHAEADRERQDSAARFARMLEHGAPADELHREKAHALDICGRVLALEFVLQQLAAVYFPEAPDA